MERLLARLERSFGKYAIPNLIGYVVGGMALVAVLSAIKPAYPEHLVLDLHAVRHGQVWRLVTFLFIPPPGSPIWLLVSLYFTWWIGSSLEQAWGAFKMNVFYFMGALATIAAALAVGPDTNRWLDASLFLAFATVFPDASVLLFFIIPVRVKWLGIVAGVAALFFALVGTWETRAAVGAARADALGAARRGGRGRAGAGGRRDRGRTRARTRRGRGDRLRPPCLRDLRRERG